MYYINNTHIRINIHDVHVSTYSVRRTVVLSFIPASEVVIRGDLNAHNAGFCKSEGKNLKREVQPSL